MATYSKKILALFLLLPACASSPSVTASAERQNELAFAHFLKSRDMEKASRFALYFRSENPTDRQAQLMAQYALQSCQPKMALEYIAHLPAGREKDLFRASTLALISVPRPWDTPLLREKEPELPAEGQRETLNKEVWADEWEHLAFRVPACQAFPLHPIAEEREALAKEAEEIFVRSAPFTNLFILGLAMDVGYRPSEAELKAYLSRFSHQSKHPYFQRLQVWADASEKIPAKFKSVKQAGSKVALGELNLSVTELRPHELEIPWLAGDAK